MPEAIAAETNTPPANSAPVVAASPAEGKPGTAPAADGQQQQSTALTDPAPAPAADPAAADAKAEAKPETPVAKAPEQYADFTRPDGYEIDAQMSDKFKSLARELDLTQDQAQRLINLDAERVAGQVQQIQQESAAWFAQTKSDAEIGGDKLAENVAIAQKALEAFGTPELKAVLQKTGMGNHPEIIRAFYRAGKTISEDTFVAGGTATSGGQRDAASALYPTSKPH